MVERILSMLNQFLISNQSLEINETFKIYIKILSIEHMALKAKEKSRRPKKRTKETYQANIKKKKYGSKKGLNKKINFFGSQDVPNSFFGEPQ